jgi:hypothetical protein
LCVAVLASLYRENKKEGYYIVISEISFLLKYISE